VRILGGRNDVRGREGVDCDNVRDKVQWKRLLVVLSQSIRGQRMSCLDVMFAISMTANLEPGKWLSILIFMPVVRHFLLVEQTRSLREPSLPHRRASKMSPRSSLTAVSYP